ncbi:hypothetical protein E2C01_037535 [Portunus trituberculatus]|uniref:Uncharacterized protein n=1 Tax=Portunus trituberculatus TaxID=210409 RepID=A0A5B7F9L5_PORTR|nr:hypothetical protein [Portunus trituberculatus]
MVLQQHHPFHAAIPPRSPPQLADLPIPPRYPLRLHIPKRMTPNLGRPTNNSREPLACIHYDLNEFCRSLQTGHGVPHRGPPMDSGV